MKKLVKYHSDINKINFSGFNEKEINIFFSILFKLKNIGAEEISISFSELKSLSDGSKNNPRFTKSIENLNIKLLNLNQKIILSDKRILMFNLFNHFIIDLINKSMDVAINKNFVYMLNDLEIFTEFELRQLVSLKSVYSKNVFRLLKQFTKSNYVILTYEDFKNKLGIPKSYKNYDIDRRVINPILKELTPIFKNLKIEKTKKRLRIETIILRWEKKINIKELEQPKNIKISENLIKVLEKTKKNIYISKFLNNLKIEKLIKKYNEEELVIGLKFAYKEIKKEFRTMSYLEKTIESGIENSKTKIIPKTPSKPSTKKNLTQYTKNIIKDNREQVEEVKIDFMKDFNLLNEEEKNIVEQKAIELCLKTDDIPLKFLMDLKKMSQEVYFTTLKKYIGKIIG